MKGLQTDATGHSLRARLEALLFLERGCKAAL